MGRFSSLFGKKSAKANKAKDPVCGMEVDPARAAGTAQHGGTTFHFCSTGCLTKFNADPHRYGHPEGHAGHEGHAH